MWTKPAVVNAGARGRSRLGLRPARGKIVEGESYIAAIEIDLEHPVDRFAKGGKFVERGLEQTLLQDPVNGRYQNDKPGVQRLRRVKTPEVARIVGDQDEIAVAGIARDIPVLPAGFANMRNVMGFMAGLSGYGNQVDGETLVDQEPHDTGIAASRRRDRCTG